MTEMFPGQYSAGDQKQETPETKHLATTGEFQKDGLPADPEALQEDKGRLSRGIGNSALEASGVASPEGDTSQDSSGPPKTLSPAEALRARLLAGFQAGKNNAAPEADSSGDREKARADLLAALRGGGKESPDVSSQPPEKAVKTGESDDQPEANTQGDEQQPEMNSEKLRELIDNCLQAAQSAREGLNKAMQSIDMAGKVSSGDFQAGLSFAGDNLNQVGNAAQVLEGATSQKEIALLGNSVNEVQLIIRSLDANVDRGYLSRLLERVDEMVRFVAQLKNHQDQDRREQTKEGDIPR